MSREMKEVKLPWVKEIPVDYDVRLVKNLFSIGRGRVIAKTDIDSDNNGKMYPVYSSQTANDGCMGYIPSYDYEQDSLTWTTDGANAGTVFLRSGKFNCTNVCGILTLRNNDKYYLPFFGYSVNLSSLNSRRSDILGHKVMSNEMARFSVVFPINIEEQRQIVHFLDRKCTAIDTAIEKTKESIEKLEEYKKAVITKAVTKGLDPDAKMKDSGVEWIGEVPETWGIGKLKYFYDITLGKMVNKDNSGDEGDSYLCAANIKWDGVNTDVHRRMIFTNKEKEQYLLNDGDVLIMEGGAAGTSCIYNNEFAPCYIQNSVNRCRGKKGHVNKFLYYWMHTAFYAGYINVACNQATIMHYTKEKVAETPFVRISEHEQLEIVNYLDKKCTEINNLITKKQEAINKWEEYKKSLIYYAVTGKIDCRNEVIE